MEHWKKVKGHCRYEVSSLGNVRRLYKNGYKYRKPVFQKRYVSVTFPLKKGGFKKYSIHRLVAEHFLSNNENKPCVNHIDGNPSNNKVDNLEWCTYSENERHSYDILGKVTNGIKRRLFNKSQIEDIFKQSRGGKTGKQIALDNNCSQGVISLILNKKTYVKHF